MSAKTKITRYRVVETDNFGGDYPDEKFVGPAISEEAAKQVANIFNDNVGEYHPRFYKAVPANYQLAPGFEP